MGAQQLVTIQHKKKREINMRFVNALPKAITTVLRDYPFPRGVDNATIRKAVSCDEDMLFVTPDLDEQLQIAVTSALLNSRFANSSSIIVVRTADEARKIFTMLNLHQETNFSTENLSNEGFYPLSNKYAIRVASTFSKFKGNSYPSANDCVIITSYDCLLRNLLYRKSSDVKLKNRINLPHTNAYIFVDPLRENDSLRRTRKSFTTFDIDGILFFKRKANNQNIRMHYISPGLVPLDEQKNMLIVTTAVKISGDHEFYFNSDLNPEVLKEEFQSVLPYLMLLRLYSGQPSKSKMIQRIQNSLICRLLQNISKLEASHDFLQKMLIEILFKPRNFSEGLFDKYQKSLGDFALISKVRENSGIYTLTPFGKKFLIASTYFKEIREDPMGVLLNIKNRTQNDTLDWNCISEIFHNFTDGKLAYDDLQMVLGRLKTKGNDEDEVIAKILSRTQDSFTIFKVSILLASLQEHMTPEAKKNFGLISKAIGQNLDLMDVPLIGKKDRLAIEQAVKEELEYATIPMTLTLIALNLSLLSSDVERALVSLEKNDLLSLKTVTGKPPKGKRITYYSTKEIPEYFYKKCGDCYYYEKNHCNFWRDVRETAERKVPKEKMDYITTSMLRKDTIACEAFLEEETIEMQFSIDEFYRSNPKRFDGQTEEGEEEYTHFCRFCYDERGEMIPLEAFGTAPFPQQGSTPTRCPRCGSSFKLIQERN